MAFLTWKAEDRKNSDGTLRNLVKKSNLFSELSALLIFFRQTDKHRRLQLFYLSVTNQKRKIMGGAKSLRQRCSCVDRSLISHL